MESAIYRLPGEEQDREVHIGDVVEFTDPLGQPFKALVTAVWGSYDPKARVVPSLNLVHVSGDPAAEDQYGRQLASRPTSVVHGTSQPAFGHSWRELER